MLLFLNAVILLLCFGSVFYCIVSRKDWIINIDKKEHKLFFFYPIADFILTKFHLDKKLLRQNQVTDSIKAIYITNKPILMQRLYYCNRISSIFVILAVFNLLSILGTFNTYSYSSLLEGKYLVRPDYGRGNTQVDLEVSFEPNKDHGIQEDDFNPSSKDVTINVKERQYASEQLKKIFKDSIEFLKVNVLGKNVSWDTVCDNLNFCTSIPGTSITVDWIPEDMNLIESDGTVKNEGIIKEGKLTTVTAILSYLEEKEECRISFRILPKQLSKEELLLKKLEEEIVAASDRTAGEGRLELPVILDDFQLNWKVKGTNPGIILLMIGSIAAIAAWVLGGKDLEKRLKRRNEEMILDYPEIINKFTLLVNAGMTAKQAWFKMADDYSEKVVLKQAKKRYAYEEMLTTVRELKLGVAENNAYEQYGRRIGLISYIKFSTLIVQNLKKGNKGFTDLLKKEAITAFEERKEAARRLGEEAGTKLLIPMMLMLITVFMIIILPAFWSLHV